MNEVNSKVMALVNDLGITLHTFADASKQGIPISPYFYETSGGFYDPRFDVIAVNNIDHIRLIAGYDVDTVVLHEIGHWAGHPSRANRLIMRKASGTGLDITLKEIHTEEMTAQWVMYYLGLELGFDAVKYAGLVREYQVRHPLANKAKAKRDAFKAFRWILNASGMEALAA